MCFDMWHFYFIMFKMFPLCYFLVYDLFRNMLISAHLWFSFHIFLTDSSLTWLENVLWPFSTLLNLLSLIVWRRIWGILVIFFQYILVNGYPAAVEGVFYKRWLDQVGNSVFCKSSVSLQMFYPFVPTDTAIYLRGVVDIPHANLSASPFRSFCCTSYIFKHCY